MHTSSRSCGTCAREVYAEVAGKELTGKFRWAQRPKGKRWDFDDDEARGRALAEVGEGLSFLNPRRRTDVSLHHRPASAVAADRRADNWPGWRGPTPTVSPAEKRLPVTWSKTENIRWKVAVPGAGVSSRSSGASASS